MSVIVKIISVEKKGGLVITTALLDSQDKVTGVGEYSVGEEVNSFFHDQYNKAKMYKKVLT
jgi:hypothetical protein